MIGVHDDRIKWTERPAPILGAMQALGLGGMRVTLEWRRGKRHLTTPDHDALRRAVAAHAGGVRIVLGVYGRPSEAPRGQPAREDYCRFVRNVLLAVRRGPGRRDLERGELGHVLASRRRCCRGLRRAARPLLGRPARIDAERERPDDDRREPRPCCVHSRCWAAFRASGRQLPLFDAAGHNPYPLFPAESPAARHDVYIGQGDYDRLVAVLDESFSGTAQGPTPIWFLENGFQTTTAGKRRRSHYSGRESVSRTLAPEEQAAQIAAALRLASCQPRVAAYFNFLLVDETVLGGWQSGLLWADWRRKPAFDAYRAAIAEVRGGTVDCAAALRS